jgi:ribonuclease P protein component
MPAERRRRARLSRSGDVDRVYREGRSAGNRYLVLHAFPRPEATDREVRLGVSVGRKVGNAAERNSVKRALREAFWATAGDLPEAHDFVLVARADALVLVEREGTAGIGTALGELLAEAGLPKDGV